MAGVPGTYIARADRSAAAAVRVRRWRQRHPPQWLRRCVRRRPAGPRTSRPPDNRLSGVKSDSGQNVVDHILQRISRDVHSRNRLVVFALRGPSCHCQHHERALWVFRVRGSPCSVDSVHKTTAPPSLHRLEPPSRARIQRQLGTRSQSCQTLSNIVAASWKFVCPASNTRLSTHGIRLGQGVMFRSARAGVARSDARA